MMAPMDYVLVLGTGERIEIVEYDYERFPGVLTLPEDIVRGCAVMSREDVESAKRGWDQGLRKALRDPVSGLMNVQSPTCSHSHDCVMFRDSTCTAWNVSLKKPIPVCYERILGGVLQELATSVVLSWAARKRVILVVPKSLP